jgi:hypothetical protein
MTSSAELWSHPAGRIISAEQQNVEVVVALAGTDGGSVTRVGAGRRTDALGLGMVWLECQRKLGQRRFVISAPCRRTFISFCQSSSSTVSATSTTSESRSYVPCNMWAPVMTSNQAVGCQSSMNCRSRLRRAE